MIIMSIYYPELEVTVQWELKEKKVKINDTIIPVEIIDVNVITHQESSER